ncbi:hypothetical protein PGT21_002827 [Puccinia graminis f. sp. tritici]|uniref:Uncharacterized protein n=1 Tax=Puccinia graminis f. sp. tritici TaxID=56615 RepID=A0A5B0MC12_PUCGR|nr:hypothetical protein PGT21_002827 [Puccinia graminis f. sp. tritici]
MTLPNLCSSSKVHNNQTSQKDFPSEPSTAYCAQETHGRYGAVMSMVIAVEAKSHQWQASLHLGTDAFNMARVAKDNVQFHEAIKKLQESFELLPDEHDRELGGYLEAFKSAISK